MQQVKRDFVSPGAPPPVSGDPGGGGSVSAMSISQSPTTTQHQEREASNKSAARLVSPVILEGGSKAFIGKDTIVVAPPAKVRECGVFKTPGPVARIEATKEVPASASKSNLRSGGTINNNVRDASVFNDLASLSAAASSASSGQSKRTSGNRRPSKPVKKVGAKGNTLSTLFLILTVYFLSSLRNTNIYELSFHRSDWSKGKPAEESDSE